MTSRPFSHQVPIAIYDPTQPDNRTARGTPFPGNIITNPNPIALKFLSHFPKCNVGANCDSATSRLANNFFAPGLDPLKAHRFDVRLDWNKSEKQRIFTRFSYDRLFFSTFNAFNNMWDPNYAQNVTNGRNILVADDLTLNSSTVLAVALLVYPPILRIKEEIPGRWASTSRSWAFRPRWLRRRSTNSSRSS